MKLVFLLFLIGNVAAIDEHQFLVPDVDPVLTLPDIVAKNTLNHQSIDVKLPFTLYVEAKPHGRLQVSTNGIIAFTKESIFEYKPTSTDTIPSDQLKYPALYPCFRCQMGTDVSAAYFTKTSAKLHFQALLSHKAPHFYPQHILAFTFTNTHDCFTENSNTFQVLVGANHKETYVCYLYAKITDLLYQPTVGGYQFSTKPGEYFKFPDVNPVTGSNVEIPGVWCFQISKTPKTAITLSPQPTGPPQECPEEATSFCQHYADGAYSWLHVTGHDASRPGTFISCAHEVARCLNCPFPLRYNEACNKCTGHAEFTCAANPADRIDCFAFTETQCQKKGCCWNYDTDHKIHHPTCYHRIPKRRCSVNPRERQLCEASNEISCHKQHCCWDINESTCYLSNTQVDPHWKSECDRPTETPPTTKSPTECLEIPKYFCQYKKAGVYPVFLAPHLYYQCIPDGRGYCRRCPQGTVFCKSTPGAGRCDHVH